MLLGDNGSGGAAGCYLPPVALKWDLGFGAVKVEVITIQVGPGLEEAGPNWGPKEMVETVGGCLLVFV